MQSMSSALGRFEIDGADAFRRGIVTSGAVAASAVALCIVGGLYYQGLVVLGLGLFAGWTLSGSV